MVWKTAVIIVATMVTVGCVRFLSKFYLSLDLIFVEGTSMDIWEMKFEST